MIWWPIVRSGARIGVSVLLVALGGCGTAPDQMPAGAEQVELTFIGIDQFNTPVPVIDSQQPTLHLVTVDLRVVFRFAEHPRTMVIDFEGLSGRRTHNELNLVALAPDIADATDGGWDMRAPVRIPELGALRFDAVLVEQSGRVSSVVGGGFTVESSFGGANSGQTSDGNLTTQTDTP